MTHDLSTSGDSHYVIDECLCQALVVRPAALGALPFRDLWPQMARYRQSVRTEICKAVANEYVLPRDIAFASSLVRHRAT